MKGHAYYLNYPHAVAGANVHQLHEDNAASSLNYGIRCDLSFRQMLLFEDN